MTIEVLTTKFVDGDEELSIGVWREVAEDDLGIEEIDGEQFSDWVQQNQDRILAAAKAKIARSRHEHVSGTVQIKPGDLRGS